MPDNIVNAPTEKMAARSPNRSEIPPAERAAATNPVSRQKRYTTNEVARSRAGTASPMAANSVG